MSRTTGALAVLFLAASLAACGDDDGVPPVTADDLASEISSRMEEEVGVAPEVECPTELIAEVGAVATCTIAASAEVTDALVVEATVTEVDEEERLVMFDIAVSTAEEEASPEPTPTTSTSDPTTPAPFPTAEPTG